jgi:hypothetical protein
MSRLEILKKGLEKIQQGLISLEAVENQLNSLQTVQGEVEEIKQQIKSLNFECESNKVFVRNCNDATICKGDPDSYNNALNVAGKLSNQVISIQEKVGKISIFFESNSSQIKQMKSLLNGLNSSKLNQTIQNLLSKLNNQLSQKADSPNKKTSKKDWEEINNTTQYLFDEYIDFLGGLAIRGSQLDSNICNFADELLEELRTQGYETSDKGELPSIIIPARDEAMKLREPLARLIRLGFPEWTIWSLPLVLSELSYILIDDIPTIKQFKESKVEEIKRGISRNKKIVNSQIICFNHLITDAIGTFNLGPSYACATILLRLNILPQTLENNLISKRYEMILTMLKKMTQGRVTNNYSEFVDPLNTAWSEYVLQTKIPELNNDEKSQIQSLVESLFPILSKAFFTLYSDQEWLFLKDNITEIYNIKYASSPFCKRHILNYAWYKRIDEWENTETIATDAVNMWCEINRKREEQKFSGDHKPTFKK